MTTTKTVVMAGSDPTVCQLLASLALSSGFYIENLQCNEEILARLQARPCDLVLTDVKSPAIDDVRLLREMRDLRPDVKVIVLTSESTPNAIIDSIREHAFSYFTKPFDLELLAEMVASALELPGWADGIEVVSARPEWLTLRVECRKLAADRLLQFLREMKMDLPKQERENIATAFREMLLNAMEYGGCFDPQQKVDIEYVRTSRVVMYHLQDPGEGFALDHLLHAAISNPPESPTRHMVYRTEQGLRPGGFGILITRNLIDELIYNEKGNEVMLIKYVQK